jgi:glycosyltransferase involved in cell wall biosynthesis
VGAVRIVVTVPWGEGIGGAESMLRTFLDGVDRSRVEPVVIFLEPGGFERHVSELGIETAVVEAGRLRQPIRTARATTKLARMFRRHRPDLILNWSPKTQLYGGAAALLAGMPRRLVWWQHGASGRHLLDRIATALPARAVGCSSVAAAEAQQRLWPRRRTFVVHPGVAQADDAKRDGVALRRELGIPESRIVLGVVGRLERGKGQDRFLRVVSELRSRGHDVHGLVVGGDAHGLSGGYAERLAPLVRELGVEPYVTLTGQVDDIPSYLEVTDILISPSIAESFGIAIIEAMSVGVPVVAVGAEGPSEIIEPGRTGVLVDSGAPERIAESATPLIEDTRLRARYSAAARELARSRFSAADMTEKLTAEVERLAREAS